MIDFNLLEIEVERLWRVSSSGAVDANINSGGCCAGIFSGGSNPVSFRISPMNCNRAFELRVQTTAEAEEWISVIVQHIRSADQRTSLRTPCQLNASYRLGGTWWKVQRISANEFVNLADTGDILLFRSKGVFSRLVRAASGPRAQYDHVGVLVRLGDGNLGILEATGSGVDILPWSEFLENEYQDLYRELALRRVHFKRYQLRLQAFQTWCHEVVGKPYCHLRRLAARQLRSTGGQAQRESRAREALEEDISSDFFCSELVAESLKALSVIPSGRPSAQYWPATFSASRGPLVDCTEGCSIDSVSLVIDFKL